MEFHCQRHHVAFDRLELHIPLLCSASQTVNILLKFQSVLYEYILNIVVVNSRQQRLIFESMSVEITLICKENNRGQRVVPCESHDKTRTTLILLHIHFSAACNTGKNLSILSLTTNNIF